MSSINYFLKIPRKQVFLRNVGEFICVHKCFQEFFGCSLMILAFEYPNLLSGVLYNRNHAESVDHNPSDFSPSVYSLLHFFTSFWCCVFLCFNHSSESQIKFYGSRDVLSIQINVLCNCFLTYFFPTNSWKKVTICMQCPLSQ